MEDEKSTVFESTILGNKDDSSKVTQQNEVTLEPLSVPVCISPQFHLRTCCRGGEVNLNGTKTGTCYDRDVLWIEKHRAD